MLLLVLKAEPQSTDVKGEFNLQLDPPVFKDFFISIARLDQRLVGDLSFPTAS